MKKRDKTFLLLSTYLTILFSPKVCSDNYTDSIDYNYEYIYDDNAPYAYYNGKKIYIINTSNINKISIDEDSIYIIDDRTINNADVAIYKSYKIRNKQEMREIIKMILEYNEAYPANWHRTEESMMNEWDIHNICYYFNVDRDSTTQVDFDNQDEEKYNSIVLSKILGN